MRLICTSQHRDFFNAHQYIEFVDVLHTGEIEQLHARIQELLPNRGYKAGFDLWRERKYMKKATLRTLGCIASQLCNIASLRIAFDTLVTHTHPLPFHNTSSIADTSSIKPLAGGAFILLENIEYDQTPYIGAFPLPTARGNLLFVTPSLSIPWPALFSLPQLHLLFIAFASEKSFYRQEPNDPYAAHYKKLGYVYNDKLTHATHPLIT